MSDDWLRLIPTDPAWVPTASAAAAARALIAEFAPLSTDVAATTRDAIVFVDQGGNFDAVRCSNCDAILDVRWWGERMNEAFLGAFKRLALIAPCCGANTSLNDLAYDWPAGFARFVIDAMNPKRGWLNSIEIEQVSIALGHPVRQILRHI